MYKAIIFDLGRVLVDFDFERWRRALEAYCPYPAAEIHRRIAATDLVERFETGLIEPPDFVAQFSRILDLDIGYADFCKLWSGIFTDPLIRRLCWKGWRPATGCCCFPTPTPSTSRRSARTTPYCAISIAAFCPTRRTP